MHARDFVTRTFFARKKHACKFRDRSIIVSSGSEPPRQEGVVETAVNKNPGLIFFRTIPPMLVPADVEGSNPFFILFNLSRLNVIRVAIQKRKLMVLLSPARASRKFIAILPRKIYLPTRDGRNQLQKSVMSKSHVKLNESIIIICRNRYFFFVNCR